MNKKAWVVLAALIVVTASVLSGNFILKGGTDQENAAIHAHSDPPGHTAGEPAITPETTSAIEDEDDFEDEDEAPVIEIPLETQRMLGIKTASVKIVPMEKTIRLTGRIEYNEQKLFTVNTKVEGWIEKLHVDYTGRFIKKGEPILEIYSPALVAAQQDLININTWSMPSSATATDAMMNHDIELLRESARQRLRLWDIPQEQIRRVEQSGKTMRTLTIKSPVSGYVTRRIATQGMRVTAGQALLDIADLSEVWLLAEASEADADLIKLGLPVSITITGLPSLTLHSRIDYIYPVLNPETRTLQLRCRLDNTRGLLKPAMYAIAQIRVDLGNRLAVPDEALMDTGQRQVVYVDKGDDNFEPRIVRAGLLAGGMREILSGLEEGERVAASALFMLDSEAQLKGITPAAPAHGAH